MQNSFYLFDAMAFAFRAFYAIGAALTDQQNRPTNAVYGFTRILLKILREHNPRYAAVVFDAPEKNFREELYPEYKATRVKTPPELLEQIPRMHEVVKAFNLPLLCVPGVEADDVIGTLAYAAAEKGHDVVIVSGDKDLLQLVGTHVRMFDPGKPEEKAWWNIEQVKARFGVGPEYVRDALALIGDSADNIPGVRKIGEVTAAKLLAEYQCLENLYEHVDEVKGKLREYLEMDRDQAFFSRELVTIKRDVPIDIDLNMYLRKPWDKERLMTCLRDLAFQSLIAELEPEVSEAASQQHYVLVDTEEKLDELVRVLSDAACLAVDTETTNIQPMLAELVGISFCTGPGIAWYVPIRLKQDDLEDLMMASEHGPSVEFCGVRALEKLKPVLENRTISKIAHNAKYDIIVLRKAGIQLENVVMDTMVASYLTEPSRIRHNLDELSLQHLNYKKTSISDLIGKGAKAVTFDKVPLDKAAAYSCEDADMAFRLSAFFKPRLSDWGLESLLNEVEMPLVYVLADMELRGVAIDARQFEILQREITENLRKLEGEIHALAGEPFNINSPKQLQYILYEKIGLKPAKKNKTGFSTDVEVLESLAELHPLPQTVLEYRTLEKLRSTYVEALPKLVHPETGRIHTSFNQAVTATGRLSSSNPNLQNIPARTELGRRIRQGFVAGSAKACLVAADYSQIELRILAHLSKDEALCAAFESNADIHRETAARIFRVSPDEVTPDMRRQAKAINFGVIYGMGEVSLAKSAGLTREEARKFIHHYFETYPGVAQWLEAVKNQARKDGYVTTLLQRRRHLPEINSSNARDRSAAERMAINTPVQGSAADIIKVAMVRLAQVLKGFQAALVLQVHDELVVECTRDCAEAVAQTMRSIMESAIPLRTPLKTEVGIGANWAEIH